VFREELRDKIRLTQKEGNGNQVFKEPPSISFSNLPHSTKSQEIALNGLVKDQNGLELVSVFVGDDKVILLPSSNKEVPLSMNVKLNKGANLITVLARDKDGLTSRESVVVRFGE